MNIKQIIKNYLDENQVELFRIKDLKQLFTGYNTRALNIAIQEIINFEYSKIENGKYCRNTFRNEYVIGNFLTSDAVIAYWSALNIHGLTEQFPNKVFVQTTKKKNNTKIFGVNYQFVKVQPNKMTGIIKTGIGSNQFRITNIEKTIIDCFDMLDYSGGFMELIRAFKRTKLNAKKMIVYSKAVNNSAVIKRIAYLAELLNKKTFKLYINFAEKHRSKNYDLFDIYGYDEGKYNSRWRLRLNMDEDSIFEIVNSIY